MKLNFLQLCNYRQFYGKTPIIKFASGERNTTVIYGNNGAGKTSILNAFTWILYEKFTAAFASPELLINQRAINEAEVGAAVECWGELQFERDRKLYQLKRKCYATKEPEQVRYSPTKLFMLVAADDGRWYPPLEEPEEIIESILPSSLHQYFFFDGERIDRFFRGERDNKIAEDTKELLGVKVLDRAIEHLKTAKRTLQEDLQLLGDSETKQLLQTQIEAETQCDRLIRRQSEIEREIASLETQKRQISAKLLQSSGADELQQLREKLIEQEQTVTNSLIKTKSDLKKTISQTGYTVYLESINANFLKLIHDLRDRGLLSTGIKREFVARLLAERRCICGEQLEPETTAYQQVSSWLNKDDLQEIEAVAMRLEMQIEQMASKEFWQQVDLYQAKINDRYRQLGELEDELETTAKKLKNFPNRDIQKLHSDLERVEEKIKSLVLEQGVDRQQLVDVRQAIAKISEEIERQKITEHRQIIAKKRISVTVEAIAKLNEVRNRLETKFRLSLEQKVREIFGFISFTPYIPRLDADYRLTLVENTSGIDVTVAASTGENQILSLSFIGAIIDCVREWSQRNTLMGPDSSTFPVVMDSPFGSLDRIYRRQVAKAIPQLANQLLVLATKTQWQGEVETELASRLGREYVLVYNSPKPDCELDCLQLGKTNYPLVKHSESNFEYTEIVMVER